jgi:hypothetical protein
MSAICAVIDTLRTLANGSITGSYVAVGTAFGHPVRLICITNNTDGDMLFSTDGSTDQLFVARQSFKLFDLTTNHGQYDSTFVLPIGTQFYVKRSTVPTTGSVYIETIYGRGQ